MNIIKIGQGIFKTVEGLVQQDGGKITEGLSTVVIGTVHFPIHGVDKVLFAEIKGEQPKYNGADILRAENDVHDLFDFDNDGDVDWDDFSEAASSFLENVSDFFADL